MTFEMTLTIGTIILVAIFLRGFLSLIFGLENDGQERKRLKSLNYDGSRIGQSDEDGTREFLQKVSEPVIRYVLPYVKIKDKEELNHDLDFVGWGKYMRAEQFRALTIIMRVAGVTITAITWNIFWPIALLLGATMIVGLPFYLRMDVNDKKAKMLSEFPEIIRLTQGYLAASQTLTNSFEHTLPYVAGNWRPVLENFVRNSRTRSEKTALDMMKEEVAIPEVREFVSLIRLSMDQGANMYESFENQYDKIRNIQLAAVMAQIHNRKTMATMIQFPILLTIFVAIGLPTVDMFMNTL